MATPNSIAVPNEVDAWIVTLQPNTNYVALVHGVWSGDPRNTLPDPFVGVASLTTDQFVQVEDNGLGGFDPHMTFQVPAAGDYVVAVGEVRGGTGTYQVRVVDQHGNPQPINFATEIVAVGGMPGGVGLPPGESARHPGSLASPSGSQQQQFGVTGLAPSDTDSGGMFGA